MIKSLQESIRPSTDLRNYYAKISKLYREKKEDVCKRQGWVTLQNTFDELRNILKGNQKWQSIECYGRIRSVLHLQGHKVLIGGCDAKIIAMK